MNFENSALVLPVETMLMVVSFPDTSGCFMTSPTASEIFLVSSGGVPAVRTFVSVSGYNLLF